MITFVTDNAKKKKKEWMKVDFIGVRDTGEWLIKNNPRITHSLVPSTLKKRVCLIKLKRAIKIFIS